jgi:hypothetical protein
VLFLYRDSTPVVENLSTGVACRLVSVGRVAGLIRSPMAPNSYPDIVIAVDETFRPTDCTIYREPCDAGWR